MKQYILSMNLILNIIVRKSSQFISFFVLLSRNKLKSNRKISRLELIDLLMDGLK